VRATRSLGRRGAVTFLNRIPIRVKLTLAFTGVMALVLAATGLLLYLRFADELDASIEKSLAARVDDVAVRLSSEGEPEGQELAEEGLSFVQILDPSGRVLDGAAPLDEPVLTSQDIARAGAGETTFERASRPSAEGDDLRLLARPVEADAMSFIVVAGASLEERDDALESLETLLLIGGPLSLLLASAAGYGVASAALRPVDSMRRRAGGISDTDLGRRLPVPPARDEISRLGETLNAMLSRLESAFVRERAFVSDASHELRTPLAILRAELELALRRGRSVEELEAAIRSALEETDRLARLADDLLLLARSDEGRLSISRKAVDVDDLLETVRARFAARAGESGRTIEVTGPGDSRLTGDPLRLEQALASLVDNALRHSEGAIRLSARPEAGSVELHVIDEGPGFSPAMADRAFERFSRADDGRTGGGTGLGLAIVQAIARAHGGDAHVGRRDGGADVWLALPGLDEREDRKPAASEPSRVPSQS